MKTNRKITAIATVLFMGFSALNGQERPTVKRTEDSQVQMRQTQTREVKTNPNVRQTQAQPVQTREVKTNPNVRQTQARPVQTREVKTNPNVRQTQARPVQTREVKTNPNIRQTQPKAIQTRETHAQVNTVPNQRQTTRYNETVSRPVMANNKPVNYSTTHNAKPNAAGNHTKPPVKENKFSEKRYYSGHLYHPFYPTGNVRTHYHHDTHIHHYNVLYYPAYHEIYWTRNMYRDYNKWYPNYRWTYNYGYRIQTISIFDAKYNLGEVAMVYGRVYATWHNRDTDDYLLFFGGDFPAQQFTVVLPGYIARKFSWRPERYFLGEHMTVTGLITTFDGIPEIIVKNRQQVGIY